MDSLHQVRIPCERLEGGRIIGLQEVHYIVLLRLEIHTRLPGQVILKAEPEPLNRVQCWTIRWPLHRPHIGGPPQALGGMVIGLLDPRTQGFIGGKAGRLL